MIHRSGIVIYDTECGDYWAARLERSGLDTLGIHPAGGGTAHLSLAACAEFVKTDRYLAFRERIRRAGISIEFEMHALSWMLPRELFGPHPDWFREQDGVRIPEFNCCASNPDVIEHLSERAAALATVFPSDTGLYSFWIDDVAEAKCGCRNCRALSASDQALAITNAIAEGVRRVDPKGRVAYLAYCGTLEPPGTVSPSPNVFLEFAPIKRDMGKSLFDPASDLNASQARHLPALLSLFGRKDSRALDYWMDNSLFSNWKRPPAQFTLNADVCRADMAGYAALGIEAVTSFGCFLGEEYRDLWGDAPVEEYFEICSKKGVTSRTSNQER